MNTTTLRNETIEGRTGKTLGTRYFFGDKSARELKLAAGELGLTGAARRRFIHEGLTTPDGARKAAALEMVAELTAGGYSADTADVKRSGAVIRFAKLPKVSSGRKLSKAAAMAAELARLQAEIAALKAGK